MSKPDYDWIVVGAGAAGISIAEMLSRLGLKILLLEKNQQLAAETSKIFHEWLHTGALYTLVPDRLKTTRYLLGAIDDLFEYYSGYTRMNLAGTESGLHVQSKGWFNDEPIFYRYRARSLNPVWSLAVARARWLINEIDHHDWIRRRAGSIHDGFRFNVIEMIRNYPNSPKGFINVKSPDVTMNSRVLLTDLLDTYEQAGNGIVVNCDVTKIIDCGDRVEVESNLGEFNAHHAVICCADGISRFTNANVKISYAPMFTVCGLSDETESFVELDYHTRSCINLLNKGNGYGLAGGISVGREDQVQSYYQYCVDLHRKRNPNIKVLDMYVGLKKELVSKGQERNYLYHISGVTENVWGVVLGKFTLMFSLAPEFIRRVYRRNPPRVQPIKTDHGTFQHPMLSNPCWQDIVNKSEIK
jgi:glycine/D-amino acid oxidase-like deaminating enzyme